MRRVVRIYAHYVPSTGSLLNLGFSLKVLEKTALVNSRVAQVTITYDDGKRRKATRTRRAR